jgi:hypothetical protein
MRNAYKILGRKPEGMIGRRRGRWEDNIRIYLRKGRWVVVDSMHLVQERDQWRALVNTETNLRVP